MAVLQNTGYHISVVDGKVILDEHLLTPRYNTSRLDYFNLSTQFLQLGVWYYIGRDGYTAYISDHANNRYSSEMIIYNTIFYLGSITRYKPELFDQIFDAREQWLMSEFLNTQPQQFLYLSTAKMLGQNVLKAYASF